MPLQTVHALISHPAAARAHSNSSTIAHRRNQGTTSDAAIFFCNPVIAQSETPTHLTSPIRQCKTWDHEFKGPDGNCTTGPCCGGRRWMSGDSEGCGWCMIVCERGDRGAGPEIACFNLSLWTWPLSQLYSSCSNTCQVSSFLLPTHCFSQIWFLVVVRV